MAEPVSTLHTCPTIPMTGCQAGPATEDLTTPWPTQGCYVTFPRLCIMPLPTKLYCAALAPDAGYAPQQEAVQGVQTLPPACFAAAAFPNTFSTLSPECSQMVPATLFVSCSNLSCVPWTMGPGTNALLTNPITSAGICFAAAPQAQASPDTVLTLPPRCFGAAPPTMEACMSALTIVQCPIPTWNDQFTQGMAAAPPTQHFGCPHPTDPTFCMPPTMQVGCPGGQAAHTLPSLPQPICAASPASLSGCFPHTFFCHVTLVHCPITTITGGCPAPTSGGCPIPSQACGGFPAAGFEQTPSTFGVSDCGPTLGSPCHHPTQSGPACGSALAAQQGTIPTMFAGCHAPPSTPLSGCQPTINPVCPPVTEESVCPNPTQPAQLCSLLNPGCPGAGAAPAAQQGPLPTGAACYPPTSPEAGCPIPTGFMAECPIPTTPSTGCPGFPAGPFPGGPMFTMMGCTAAPQTLFACIYPSVNFCPPPSNVQCPPAFMAQQANQPPPSGQFFCGPTKIWSGCSMPTMPPGCPPTALPFCVERSTRVPQCPPPPPTSPPACPPPPQPTSPRVGCPPPTRVFFGCDGPLPPASPPASPTPTKPPATACWGRTHAGCLHAAVQAAPQTASVFCIQPSVNFCPPPSNVQCPPAFMAQQGPPPTAFMCPPPPTFLCDLPPTHPGRDECRPPTRSHECPPMPTSPPWCMPTLGGPGCRPPTLTGCPGPTMGGSICAPPTRSLECPPMPTALPWCMPTLGGPECRR